MTSIAWADLHIHTTCTDGSDTPEQVVELAAARGVSLMALADHNSVEGIAAARAAAASHGIALVPATEIDVQCAAGELHLLAYGIDPEHPGLQALLRRNCDASHQRNRDTMANIERAGYPLRHRVDPDALPFAQLHVAIRTALIELGYVRDRHEAYDKFLAHPDFLAPSRKITAEELFPMVAAAGGRISLAHPCKLKIDDAETVAWLTGLGLWGIEVYYGDHGEAYIPRAQTLARRHGLYPTIGSDYHGIYRDPQVGMQVPPDPALLESLAILREKAY